MAMVSMEPNASNLPRVGSDGYPVSSLFPNLSGGEEATLSNQIPNVSIDDDYLNSYHSDDNYSLHKLMQDNPGLTYEQYMSEMSKYSDEWAEKYLDYLTERGELDRANAYTAQREDTAYQRLVQDLRKAGLNPAMMYGSSASPSTSGSQGYIKMAEGANSKAVSNYSKLKQLMLGLVALEWQIKHQTTNDVFNGLNTISKFLRPILGMFG